MLLPLPPELQLRWTIRWAMRTVINMHRNLFSHFFFFSFAENNCRGQGVCHGGWIGIDCGLHAGPDACGMAKERGTCRFNEVRQHFCLTKNRSFFLIEFYTLVGLLGQIEQPAHHVATEQRVVLDSTSRVICLCTPSSLWCRRAPCTSATTISA